MSKESSKPTVNLWHTNGLGVILKTDSGIYFSNQTGRLGCLHPTEEGIYLPLYDEQVDQEFELCEHFTGPKWNGCCKDGIDVITADFIDVVLEKAVII